MVLILIQQRPRTAILRHMTAPEARRSASPQARMFYRWHKACFYCHQRHNLRGLLGDAQRLLRPGRFPILMNRYLFCCIFSLASGVLCILLAVRSPRMSLWDVGGYLFGSIGLGCLIPLLRHR